MQGEAQTCYRDASHGATLRQFSTDTAQSWQTQERNQSQKVQLEEQKPVSDLSTLSPSSALGANPSSTETGRSELQQNAPTNQPK